MSSMEMLNVQEDPAPPSSSPEKEEEEEEKPKAKGGEGKGKSFPMPFHEACDAGNLDVVEEYIAAYTVEELSKMTDTLGWTGLHYAARSGQEDVVVRLLDIDFPIDIVDKSGSTALYRATGFGHNNVVFLLAERGGNCLHTNNQGDNMIHNSAWAGNAELTRFFISEGVDLLQKNKSGRIALQDVVEKLPGVAEEIFETRKKIVSSYLLEVQVEYDFDGIDDLDSGSNQTTPLEIILQENHLDLVDQPVIRTLLMWKWEVFAKKMFLRRFFLYVFVLAIYSYVAISTATYSDVLWKYVSVRDYVRGALEIIVVIFALLALHGELKEFLGAGSQIVDLDNRFALFRWFMMSLFPKAVNPLLVTATSVKVPRYLFDVWNMVDLMLYLLIVASAIVRALTATETVTLYFGEEKQLMASISILFWFKLLQLMGVSQSIGPLIRSIYRMFFDFAQFLVIYVLFWMGFSIAFFVLLSPSPMLSYANFGLATMSSFRMTVGDFDWESLYAANNITLLQVFFVLFVLISNILLLNLLIAMLSNTFELVKYVAEKEWLMEWATLIMRFQRELGRRTVKKMMEASLTQLKKDSYTVQNFSPQARVYDSKKFTKWEPKAKFQRENEVDIQVLRNQLESMMTSQFKELKADMETLRNMMASQMEPGRQFTGIQATRSTIGKTLSSLKE